MILAVHASYSLRIVPPLVAILVGVVARTDRSLIARLRDAEATSRDRALDLQPLSGFRAMRLQRLTDGGVVVATNDGRYFLDEEGWTQYRSERKRRAIGAVAIVLFAGGLVFLFAR